jgi:2-polyprenyl-3-methyl-5-hydroxy-6-metoxy-1,4-benzoquinol methylase
MIKELPDHLGGHLNQTHIAGGALRYIKREFDIKSFLDIGCGSGDMIQVARDIGLFVNGKVLKVPNFSTPDLGFVLP